MDHLVNSLPQQTITLAFEHLKNDVHIAVHTQVGDTARLNQHLAVCDELEIHIQNVCSSLFSICSNYSMCDSTPMY